MSLPAEEYRIEALEGSKSLEAIRDLWHQWQFHPNADFDFFATVVESRSSVVCPITMVLYNKDAPVALTVGRLEKTQLPSTFGYLKILNSSLLQYSIVYGGLMGAWDEKGAAVLIEYLRQWIKTDRIDAVYFSPMKKEHPVYQAALHSAPFFLRHIPLNDNFHWWAEVADTPDLLKSKVNKRDRKKERQLTDYSHGEVEFKIFQTPEEVPEFCSIAESISQTTYLRGLGAGFYDNQEMRNRLELTSQKGWMCGFVLYANQKPCAFQLGTLYQGVLYLDYTGYNADLHLYSPGRILFVKMLEHLCNTHAVRGIDFGFGDAEFKRRYADRNWKESDLYLFNQTSTLLLTNLVRKSVTMVHVTAENALNRSNLLAIVKKRWRHSVQKSDPISARADKN